MVLRVQARTKNIAINFLKKYVKHCFSLGHWSKATINLFSIEMGGHFLKTNTLTQQQTKQSGKKQLDLHLDIFYDSEC